jgi:hypothetical protein
VAPTPVDQGTPCQSGPAGLKDLPWAADTGAMADEDTTATPGRRRIVLAALVLLVLAAAVGVTMWVNRSPVLHFCPAAASQPIGGGSSETWKPGDPGCPPYGPVR